MNLAQKMVLVGVIIIIGGMLAYPPFQIVARSGAILNMGYGWIIDPPKQGYITATVNVAMLLMQWLAALVIGCIAFFLANSKRKKPHASNYKPQNEFLPTDQSQEEVTDNSVNEAVSARRLTPSGVGGWLLLLVAGMMVLGPLFGASGIGADIMKTERQYPTITSMNEWIIFKSLTWCTFLIAAAISFYGGWGLARGRDWSSVKRAKVILWITGPIASLVLGWLVPLISFPEFKTVDALVLASFISSATVAAIWTAYLSKSKRVRNTYGVSVPNGN